MSEVTYEVTITQFEETSEPKPTEDDLRRALLDGLPRAGFMDIAAVDVKDVN